MEEPNKGGAPLGNANAAKGKVWNDALRKAIVQDDKKRIAKAIDQLLDQAAAGEQWAIKELGDRLDGKPAQVIAGDPDAPLEINSHGMSEAASVLVSKLRG